MKERMHLVVSFVALFGLAFYLINYDFENFQSSIVKDDFGIPKWWTEKYGVVVYGQEDLNIDSDGDGLSLIDEFKYHTSPINPDTDGDGYNDGKEVKDGYSPIGEGRMDYDKDNLPDKWEEENGLSTQEKNYDHDPDGDGLANYLEFAYQTNPLESDTDGDGYDDYQEIKNGYDPDAEGDKRPEVTIKIKKVGVNAPVIFAASFLEKDLQANLQDGVVLYPKTGTPGQIGNVVVTGHSSNYAWAKGDYNYVFEKINDLKEGDEIILESRQANGAKFEYKYYVTTKEVMDPNDSRIFEDSGDQKVLTIATCWPLGTNFRRMVLKAEMK